MLLQTFVLLGLRHALLFAAVLVRGGGREVGTGLGAALVVLFVIVLGIEGLLDIDDFVFKFFFGLLQILLHHGGLEEPTGITTITGLKSSRISHDLNIYLSE